MLLVIHNLPGNTRYSDVKALIKDKCGLTEMIVDNLVAEGKSKKVTVGLAEEVDAAILVRKINGLYVGNQQLYVEDVRQKRTNEQPYRPNPMAKLYQYEQPRFNQGVPSSYENPIYGQQSMVAFQQPQLPIDSKIPTGPPPPNFSVPFYMTAQNKNVGNNLQFMIQYPKVQQGTVGNDSYGGRDIGFDQQYRESKGNMSPDRGPDRERLSRSRWNNPDCNTSDGRKDRERPVQRDDRHAADQSYKDRSYRDSFQSRANLEYGSDKQDNKRFVKPSGRSDSNWVRSDHPSFGDKNQSFRFNDDRNLNVSERRFDQDKEKVRENNQFRDSDFASRPGNFSKKRPFESDKNKFGPQIKKFGNNQQFNAKHQQGPSGSKFSNYQNKKNAFKKSSNHPSMQQKGFQKNKWQAKNQTKFTKHQPGPNEKPAEETLARHEAWLVQASAVIATDIVADLGKIHHKRDPVVVKLKDCVRARLDTIIGDNMSLGLKDMLFAYRQSFRDDEAFYSAVLQKVQSGVEDEIDIKKREREEKKLTEIKPKAQFIGKAPGAVVPNPGNPQRLPKYPDGNKKVLSQMKQAHKDEMLNESLYVLDAEREKALEEELDKIDQLIRQEVANPENEAKRSVSEFICEVVVPDLRKILNLHVRKRILDVRTSLSVRVICQYKAPNRDKLDSFLQDYGVISLKPSEKNRNVYVAICDSYENYDALCKLEFTVIDTLKISFKPLHITGPPLKGKFKRQFNVKINAASKAISTDDDQVISDGKQENAGEKSTGIKKKEIACNIQQNQANNDSQAENTPSNKNEDVIKIEDNATKSEDVIVINESDDKFTREDDDVKFVSETPTANADSKTTDYVKGATINNESISVGDEVKEKCKDEIAEQYEPGIIDNDNIADDDLEDF